MGKERVRLRLKEPLSLSIDDGKDSQKAIRLLELSGLPFRTISVSGDFEPSISINSHYGPTYHHLSGVQQLICFIAPDACHQWFQEKEGNHTAQREKIRPSNQVNTDYNWRLRDTGKHYNKGILDQLDDDIRLFHHSPRYIDSSAEQILEYAQKNHLDPKRVYHDLCIAEFDVCVWYKKFEDPTTALDYYDLAMSTITDSFRQGISPATPETRKYLETAIILAKKEEETTKPLGWGGESIDYQIILDWVDLLYGVKKQHFMDHD